MPDADLTQRDRLAADLRLLIHDAEDLLRVSAGQVGEEAVAVRARIQERLGRAREQLASLQADAIDKAKAAGRATDDYVHDHPWRSVGVAAGIGVLVGLLIGRR
jgi:ElaB/YqjD/DUF883 family membrane-anchored ribosome-binding protein